MNGCGFYKSIPLAYKTLALFQACSSFAMLSD